MKLVMLLMVRKSHEEEQSKKRANTDICLDEYV